MPFLLVLAVIPVVVLLFIIFKIDKHEKEPIGLLISLFFLGVVAVIPVFIAELIMEAYFTVNLDTSSYYFYFCEAFFVAGLCEEGLKYFFLRIRTSLRCYCLFRICISGISLPREHSLRIHKWICCWYF